MTTRCVPGLLYLALSLAPCQGAILYVNQHAPGPTHDGRSWATAFVAVQQGIDPAKSGDEVWVAAGTYPERLSLKSAVGLYGGFLGDEQSRSLRDPGVNLSLLDGQSAGTVITIAADATAATVVDGFTIQNGVGPIVGSRGAGGGIIVMGGTPIISNNIITGCRAQGAKNTVSKGGGIYVETGGKPLIAGNRISYCYAMFGGAIYVTTGGLIRDNVFTRNASAHGYLSYGRGGAIESWGPTAIVHNVFDGNSCVGGGGGGAIDCSFSLVADNLFVDNEGTYGAAIQSIWDSSILRNSILATASADSHDDVAFSGGVFSNNLIATETYLSAIELGVTAPGNYHGTEPVITNNTIVNTGPGGQYAVFCSYYAGEKPTFSNNVITGWAKAGSYGTHGTAPAFTTDHNDLYGNGDNTLPFPGANQVGENGTVSADPLFVDAANGDYRLQAGSPCIDAGNDTYVSSGDRDLLGAPRIAGAHVDIGAYEYGSPAWTMLDAAEVLRVAAGLSLVTPAEVSRLDVAADGSGGNSLTVLDATRIAQWLLN